MSKRHPRSRRPGPQWSLPFAAALLTAPCVLAAPTVENLSHMGGATLDGAPTVRMYDTDRPSSPVLVWESESQAARASSWTTVHDGLYVAVNSSVERFDRNRVGLPRLNSWSPDEEVLGLVDGPERGTVLALHRQALSLVRFPDAQAPFVVWSEPIDLTELDGATGRLLARRGNRVYVVDPTLPGMRVVSIDSDTGPTTIATYASADGPIHDLAIWGSTLVALSDRAAVVIDIGQAEAPTLTTVGRYETFGRAASVDVTTRHLFLADGADLLVLRVDPSSENPSDMPVATWVAPTEIRAVRVDRKRGRAYVLLAESWEILDVSALMVH